ncbi:MAG: hypothetical protein LBF26_01900 [Puniceicoccales bacterium]|nr:hypothetical protein [Puniceicoccales bacterium]
MESPIGAVRALIITMKDLARCDCCGALATVFLTQVINGAATHLRLCEKCARERGFLDSSGMPPKGLAGFWDFRTRGTADRGVDLVCPKCGMTVAKLCATSRVGCAQCYSTFRNVIFEKIPTYSGATQFMGKIPTLLPELSDADCPFEPHSTDDKHGTCPSGDGHVRKLFSHLKLAIVEERYEDAAQIRDEIVTCSRKKCGRSLARGKKDA